MLPQKAHMLNGWVNTSSSSVVVTAYERLITVHQLTKHTYVRA